MTTCVAFGATVDTWNVSVYIHIVDKNTTVPHLWNKSQKMWWAGRLWDNRKRPWLPYSTLMSCYFYHFPPIFWIPWYLLHKHYLKSSHMHLLATYKSTLSQALSLYVTSGIQDFVKCCIKNWVYLDLRPDNMLFGVLQPTECKSWMMQISFKTFTEPAACKKKEKKGMKNSNKIKI